MDKITFCISIISVLTAVVSFTFSLFTYRKSVLHDRKQATLDAYNLLQEQALDKISSYFPAEIAEIAKHRSSEEYKTISRYIARIEHFCVGVNHNIYDREIVYELAHGFLDGAIKNRISPILNSKSFNKSDEDFYSNIKSVLLWMEQKANNKIK